MDIFLSCITENDKEKTVIQNQQLAVACLYIISFSAADDSNLAKRFYEDRPALWEKVLILFKERPFDSNFLLVLYGTFTSLLKILDTRFVLGIEQQIGFVDQIVGDAVDASDARRFYAGFIAIRILLDHVAKLNSQESTPILSKLIEAKISDMMIRRIFDQRFNEHREPPPPNADRRAHAEFQQFDTQRILHSKFLHPSSLCTLNRYLSVVTRVNDPESISQLQKTLSEDPRYQEMFQLMRYLEGQKAQKFSYRWIFILIGLIILVLLAFPVAVRLFGGVDTPSTPPPSTE